MLLAHNQARRLVGRRIQPRHRRQAAHVLPAICKPMGRDLRIGSRHRKGLRDSHVDQVAGKTFGVCAKENSGCTSAISISALAKFAFHSNMLIVLPLQRDTTGEDRLVIQPDCHAGLEHGQPSFPSRPMIWRRHWRRLNRSRPLGQPKRLPLAPGAASRRTHWSLPASCFSTMDRH